MRRLAAAALALLGVSATGCGPELDASVVARLEELVAESNQDPSRLGYES